MTVSANKTRTNGFPISDQHHLKSRMFFFNFSYTFLSCFLNSWRDFIHFEFAILCNYGCMSKTDRQTQYKLLKCHAKFWRLKCLKHAVKKIISILHTILSWLWHYNVLCILNLRYKIYHPDKTQKAQFCAHFRYRFPDSILQLHLK